MQPRAVGCSEMRVGPMGPMCDSKPTVELPGNVAGLANMLHKGMAEAVQRVNNLDLRLRCEVCNEQLGADTAGAPGILDTLETAAGLMHRLHLALNSLETRIGG